MTKLGLTLNKEKTSLKDARTERFDFLGYTFASHRYRKDGHSYLGASLSKKSVLRIKTKIGDILVPGNKGAWPDVRDRLNWLLLGWSAYFGYSSPRRAMRRSCGAITARPSAGPTCGRNDRPLLRTKRTPGAARFKTTPWSGHTAAHRSGQDS